jgi:methyl coenzyme M reductase subunit C
MAGSTVENAAAEDAAEAMEEGSRHIQMGVERLRVRVRERGEVWSLVVLLRGGLAVPLLLWRRGESFMKRWSLSLDT